MNKVKKLMSVLLALALVLAMGTTVFAAGDNYSITINNDQPDHHYEAYQIFSGDLSKKDGTKVLSNIEWGSGVDAAMIEANSVFGGKTAAEVAASLDKEEDAKKFAQQIAPYLKGEAANESGAQSNGQYKISDLEAGYYLVKDKDNSLADKDDFYTAYIMQVVGDVTAEPKGEKPTLEKQVKHNDDDSWGVVGDNQIGDTVEFRTISTVPNTEGYTKYDYIISDTMSDGLTSNVKSADDVTIKVKDATDLAKKYYTVESKGNGFTVKIDILKAIKDGVIQTGNELYTYYSGVLNEKAKVYNDGSEDNVAHLEYSNNPNDDSDKGKTPDSKVYDWTFKMGVNKVDGENKPLTGAKFVLSKNDNLKVADLACGEDGVPTKTGDLIGLVKVSDGVYRVAKAGEANVIYDIDAGTPVIKGLDDSTDYFLYETKAPEGYNLLKEPVKFNITAKYNEGGSKLEAGYPQVTVGNGTPSTNLSTDVVNKSGSNLPSTGGIGTTIFYTIGGLLVVGAGVLLITKKRMSKTEG